MPVATTEHMRHQEEGIFAMGCEECAVEEREERSADGIDVDAEVDATATEEASEEATAEMGLVAVEEDPETAVAELEEAHEWHDDPATEPEPEEPPEEPVDGLVLSTRALVKSYGIRDASNGATIAATIEVDTYVASDFEELIGESIYTVQLDGKDYGLARVTGVSTRADADNRPHTKVGFGWSGDQRPKAKELSDAVGVLGLTLKLLRFQEVLDLTTQA